MSPFQHGEVFVTDDGAETDLDLGHYERFTDEPATHASSVTTGQVYNAVIGKERRGGYLGTIRSSHITTRSSSAFIPSPQSNADVVICGLAIGMKIVVPEAIRQMRHDAGVANTLHPCDAALIGATHELKTKPTQHSVMRLLRAGIQPDVILCRADYEVSDDPRQDRPLLQHRSPRGDSSGDGAQHLRSAMLDAGLGDFLVESLRSSRRRRWTWRTGALVERITAPADHGLRWWANTSGCTMPTSRWRNR
jgi:CTP synthase